MNEEFEINENGFFAPEENINISWNEIVQIAVYKKDGWTVDCIFLEIITGKSGLKVSEDHPNYEKLAKFLKKNFNFNKEWWRNVASPAFHENYCVLYKKDL